MATIRFILGIICLALCSGNFKLNGNLLVNKYIAYSANQEERKIIAIAVAQLGVQEATGQNDGKQVEAYLHYTGNKKGEPWCASFVSWVFGKANYKAPRTAWSPALFPAGRLSKTAKPAMVFGIYFPKLKRIAHCGIIELQKENWLYTIEGNTDLTGGRTGGGVYKRWRHARTIQCYADWLKHNKKEVANEKAH